MYLDFCNLFVESVFKIIVYVPISVIVNKTDCAEIHAVFYYFILLTSECEETVAKVVSVSYKYMFICYLIV